MEDNCRCGSRWSEKRKKFFNLVCCQKNAEILLLWNKICLFVINISYDLDHLVSILLIRTPVPRSCGGRRAEIGFRL